MCLSFMCSFSFLFAMFFSCLFFYSGVKTIRWICSWPYLVTSDVWDGILQVVSTAALMDW